MGWGGQELHLLAEASAPSGMPVSPLPLLPAFLLPQGMEGFHVLHPQGKPRHCPLGTMFPMVPCLWSRGRLAHLRP